MKKLKEIFAWFGIKTDNKNPPQQRGGPHSNASYQCLMKCEGDMTYDIPGNCPVCYMMLVPATKIHSKIHKHEQNGHGNCKQGCC